MLTAARGMQAVVRRKPRRDAHMQVISAAAAMRRCWLGKWARDELKRRRRQRARDALLAPALVPSKQLPLHQHLSPRPPSTSRRTDLQGPSGFRKRLISSGQVTQPSSCPVAENAAPPLKGCRAPRGSWDAGEEGGYEEGEDEQARERRLLHEQQQRISADIARAGARAPKDGGVFPHEIVQGGSGAALLALRTRNRG